MSTLAAFLMGISIPLVLRVVAALGFSVITYTGVTEFWSQLVGIAQANWSALPVTAMQLAGLSGIPEMLGMIFGAYATRMALWVAVSATRFIVR